MEVSTPESVIQWYTNFYEEALSSALKPLECIQEPGLAHLIAGDLVFVPSTWWHSVINLEESVAVTQNVVNSHNLLRVAQFLKKKQNPDLWNNFRSVQLTVSELIWRSKSQRLIDA